MKRVALAISAGITASIMSAPAFAQSSSDGSPYRIMEADNKDYGRHFLSEHTIRKFMQSPQDYQEIYRESAHVADCLFETMGNDSGDIVGGEGLGDADYRGLHRALLRDHPTCVGERSRGIPLSLVSSSLAERLVLENGRDAVLRPVKASRDDVSRFVASRSGGVTFEVIGRCAAVYSPALAYDVLETPVGSKEEAASLQRLYEQTPQCGLKERPSQVPSPYQRSVIAAGLYQWQHRG